MHTAKLIVPALILSALCLSYTPAAQDAPAPAKMRALTFKGDLQPGGDVTLYPGADRAYVTTRSSDGVRLWCAEKGEAHPVKQGDKQLLSDDIIVFDGGPPAVAISRPLKSSTWLVYTLDGDKAAQVTAADGKPFAPNLEESLTEGIPGDIYLADAWRDSDKTMALVWLHDGRAEPVLGEDGKRLRLPGRAHARRTAMGRLVLSAGTTHELSDYLLDGARAMHLDGPKPPIDLFNAAPAWPRWFDTADGRVFIASFRPPPDTTTRAWLQSGGHGSALHNVNGARLIPHAIDGKMVGKALYLLTTPADDSEPYRLYRQDGRLVRVVKLFDPGVKMKFTEGPGLALTAASRDKDGKLEVSMYALVDGEVRQVTGEDGKPVTLKCNDNWYTGGTMQAGKERYMGLRDGDTTLLGRLEGGTFSPVTGLEKQPELLDIDPVAGTPYVVLGFADDVALQNRQVWEFKGDTAHPLAPPGKVGKVFGIEAAVTPDGTYFQLSGNKNAIVYIPAG